MFTSRHRHINTHLNKLPFSPTLYHLHASSPIPISSIQFHLHFHLRFFTATTLSVNNFSGDGRAQTHSAFYITDFDRSQ
ncbi:uncharacterized protein IAS62_000630 [Cryptococcus decagattii]|uniref:Uncharacterized protein n=1 Tax=Cryptococcus decagattii TaxID=1859122 RepID=A0ABZ2AQ92_9TREE